MHWICRDRRGAQALGYIPSFLVDDDPRPAAEQFGDRYIGGWSLIPGCEVTPRGWLTYPGDPPQAPLAFTIVPGTGEKVLVYDYGVVAIVQPDGSAEVARLD